MEIILYITKDDPRHVTKTFLLGSKTYNLAYATHALDLLKPEIELSDTGLESFNYMKITDLNRYYFIKPELTANGFYRLNAKCDVLMSHATQIRKENGIIGRSSNVYNTFLTDALYNSLCYRRVQTLLFDKTPFSTSGNGYYLTATGGTPNNP